MSQSPTVYLIDHEESSRSATLALLQSVDIPALSFGSALDFLEQVHEAGPGCIVLDTRLPGMGGLELQERIATWEVPPPVIVTTAHGDIPMAVQAMRNGAIDFLEKPFRAQVLLDRIYEAFERDTAARQTHERRAAIEARADSLTAREREVMIHVVAGHPNKVVAQRLGVTRKAVEAYRARVMRKMRAGSLAELVRMNVVLEQMATARANRFGRAAPPPRGPSSNNGLSHETTPVQATTAAVSSLGTIDQRTEVALTA